MICHFLKFSDASKMRHNIRRKMAEEKVRLRERCSQYNRFVHVYNQSEGAVIPNLLPEEDGPVWPWIGGDAGNVIVQVQVWS